MKTTKTTLALMAIIALSACGRGYSDGTRVGVVTKLSHKGHFTKSWEGEMNLGGMEQTEHGMVPRIFRFTVTPGAVPAVQEAMRSGKRVELVYTQWAIAPSTQDTGYDIIEVKPAQ